MTDEQEFERCWAVLKLKYQGRPWFDLKNPDQHKQLFRDNWDACGGLEWFNEASKWREDD